MALAAAFFHFFENDSSGETAAISDQSRRARRWPLGRYQHKRGNKMKHRCNVRKGDGTVTDQKSKPPMKAKSSRFDSLVARYYPAVYSFASRLTDDPREAVALTREAFNKTRKQLRNRLDEAALASILISAVIRAGLNHLSRASRNARLKPLLCDAPDVRTRHFRKRIGTGGWRGRTAASPL
jgi:hypothetical protein